MYARTCARCRRRQLLAEASDLACIAVFFVGVCIFSVHLAACYALRKFLPEQTECAAHRQLKRG
jgi:hypothetical protein